MPQIDRQKSIVAEIGSESPQQKQAEVETYISAQWKDPFSFTLMQMILKLLFLPG